jgi:prepilin-type processing-associated H-X9-DG protein
MLLPALNAARDKAKATQCINNQKQIGTAYNFYATDNDDILPLQWYNGAGSTYRWAAWLAGKKGSTASGWLTERTNYLGNPNIVRCPNAPPFDTKPTFDASYIYGARYFVAFDGDMNPIDQVFLINAKKCRQPSLSWIMTDSWSTTSKQQIYLVTKNSTSCVSLIHNGFANTLFVDGHVGSHEMRSEPFKAAGIVNYADKYKVLVAAP